MFYEFISYFWLPSQDKTKTVLYLSLTFHYSALKLSLSLLFLIDTICVRHSAYTGSSSFYPITTVIPWIKGIALHLHIKNIKACVQLLKLLKKNCNIPCGSIDLDVEKLVLFRIDGLWNASTHIQMCAHNPADTHNHTQT